NHNPPLLVELRIHRRSEEVALHLPCLAAERVEPADTLGQLLPLGSGVDVEAAVETTRDDDPVAEFRAEAGRQREPGLVVEGVLVLAQQHRPPSPIAPHFTPPNPSCNPSGRASTLWSCGVSPLPRWRRSHSPVAAAGRSRSGPDRRGPPATAASLSRRSTTTSTSTRTTPPLPRRSRRSSSGSANRPRRRDRSSPPAGPRAAATARP